MDVLVLDQSYYAPTKETSWCAKPCQAQEQPPTTFIWSMHYVYLLKSSVNASYYVGVTSDLRRRLEEHNDGKSIYTKKHKPYVLVYYEAYRSKNDAYVREKRLKRFKNGYRELLKRTKESVEII